VLDLCTRVILLLQVWIDSSLEFHEGLRDMVIVMVELGLNRMLASLKLVLEDLVKCR
jgi:hypothetical protein